jgi:hypothetical protein
LPERAEALQSWLVKEPTPLASVGELLVVRTLFHLVSGFKQQFENPKKTFVST